MTKISKTIAYGFIFSAAYAFLMAATPADAQTANSNSNANSGSAADSRSGSASGAAAIVNQTTNVPNNTSANNTDRISGGTNNTLNTSGYTTNDTILRTTPTVYAPPVSGGNPCTLAVSGGVSVIGWGAAAGGTFVDEDCANRQKIAMIHNAGYGPAARELMCNDKATYNAFKTAGQPCAWRAAFEPQGAAPMPTPMPAVVTPTPMVQAAPKNYPRCNARLGIVDNCAS